MNLRTVSVFPASSRAPSVLAMLTLAALVACDRGHGDAAPPGPSASPASSAQASAGPMVLAPRDGIHWLQGPAGLNDAAVAIHDALVREHADGRKLLVYVGATWCEPCQRFHHAVDGGELDAAFPRLSIIAFDAERDSESLATAGYTSRLIPLFAIPRDDGHASGKQIEGSVKGETAVAEITPRLRALLSGS